MSVDFTYPSLYDHIKKSRNGNPKIANNTHARIEDYQVPANQWNIGEPIVIEVIYIRFHYSDIVRLHPDGEVWANDCGWATPTTKERINRFANTVWSKNHVWYFTTPNGVRQCWQYGAWNRIK